MEKKNPPTRLKQGKIILSAFLGCLCALQGSPATAGIAYTGLNASEYYFQDSAASLQFTQASISFSMASQAQTDFDSVTLTTPLGATTSYAYRPRLVSNGTYSAGITGGVQSGSDATAAMAQMNAAFPFGTYTIEAANSSTGARQTARLDYDFNHWPTVPGGLGEIAIPAMSASSYATLQGVNATVQHSLNFNSFVADGIPLSPGEVTPSVRVAIYKEDGSPVYVSAPMPMTTTSLLLPANTLAGNTKYQYVLQFSNLDHCGGALNCGTGNPVGFYRNFITSTLGQFTTGPINGSVTSLTLQGGTANNPTPLTHQGEIGQLNGTIGGVGSMAFYEFYWQGGLFRANSVLTDADPQAIFEFALLDAIGVELDKLALNAADNFTGDLQRFLNPGTYRVGLRSVTEFDPAYVITFDTPIRGNAVPEPGTAALAALAAAIMALARRRRTAPARG